MLLTILNKNVFFITLKNKFLFIVVCPKDLSQSDSSLPSMPSIMVCQITESCTGIDCCIRADPIHHNFHAYLDIDPCNFKIKFGIDKFEFEVYMQNFQFGVEKDVRLVNVVRIK